MTVLQRLAAIAALANYCGAALFDNQLPPGSAYGIPGTNASYDYVVVGGGTAGLTIATRLAQDGRYSVAVIEAGGFYEVENGNHTVIPADAFDPAPGIDWGFVTTPQTAGDNRSIPYTRGKCLGGSSARNDMVYQRPTIQAMQKWADEVGDQSWIWQNVLKYYKRSATFTPAPAGSRPANATPGYELDVFGNGPVQASYAGYVSPMSSWVLKAAAQLGLPARTEGLESGTLIGHSYVPLTLIPESKERSTSETSYLPLAIDSERLTVYTHSLAKKIMFVGTAASGVVVETNDVSYNLMAAREVIVSAGAFQSPQLLMVSGIGPQRTLSKYGIPVVQDRPGVGQNFWDNPFFGPSYALNVVTTLANYPQLMAEAIEEYNSNRTGYLTSNGADLLSFEKLSTVKSLNISAAARKQLAQFPSDWPEVEFSAFPGYYGSALGSTPPSSTQNYGGMAIGMIAPISRGYVTINSSDMVDPPIINPMWLTAPTDQEIAVAAFKRAREYFATPALKSITVGEEVYPGPKVTTDAEILEVIQKQFITFYHASATCKMGQQSDKMAVVDSQGRVFGAKNLRVVDVSAFPFLPPGQPQATVYMLAEKIADDVLLGKS